MRLTRSVLVGVLVVATVLAGCSRSPDPEERARFERHLQQGTAQLRLALLPAAAAELERAGTIAPDDPELLFQQARLLLAQAEPGQPPTAAIDLLDRVITLTPDSVRAHRLLHEIHHLDGDHDKTAEHRKAIERILGGLGQLELAILDDYRAGGPGKPKPLANPDPDPRFRELVESLEQLDRQGRFAPTTAVPALERLLTELPDLAAVRLYYLERLLESRVRVNFSPREDEPLMSSRLIADYVQFHAERVLDQTHPASLLATRALTALADVAVRMADYQEASNQIAILLARTGLGEERRRQLRELEGTIRLKEGRPAAAIALLEKLLAEPPVEPTALKLMDADTRKLYRLMKEAPARWVLHLAYDSAGIPRNEQANPFPWRNDLPRGGERRFEDVAPELGIDKLDGLGPSAWLDYDRDGDFDLYVSGADSYGALYQNDRGTRFTDVSVEAGLFHAQSGFSTTSVDWDNDGWPDLYIGRDGWSGPAPNALYRNRGDNTFQEVTSSSGLGDPGASFVHVWLDYNRDGHLDVFVANGITGSGDTNALYQNRGDGTFRDVTGRVGLGEPPGTKTIGVAVGDYDLDGWPDLFVSGFVNLNRLYHNRGDGTFEEVAAAAGVTGVEHVSTGYVCFFFDYDLDGWPDILRTSLAPWNEVLVGLMPTWDRLPDRFRESMLRNSPKLYRNLGDRRFAEVSVETGLVHPIGIMGANVADLDNDGFEDIYFGTGDPKVGRLEPDRFYHSNAGDSFTDLTFALGLGNVGKGHGVTLVDHDGDGDLEIYAPEGGFEHGDQWPNAFYLNQQATGNHWLHLDLQGTASNRDAIGARVVAVSGARRQTRQVEGGRGFGSSDSSTVEFGLGPATVVDELTVSWPSGAVEVLRDVAADQRLTIRERPERSPGND